MSAVRLAARLALGFGLIMAAAWLVMLWLVVRESNAIVEDELRREAASVHAFWRAEGHLPKPGWRGQLLALAPGNGGPRLTHGPAIPEHWWHREGVFAAKLPEFRDDHEAALDRDIDMEPGHVIVERFDQATVIVGHPFDRAGEIIEILNAVFAWIAALSLLAFVLLASLAALRTQKRILAIEQGLKRIAAGQFETRIATGEMADTDDDLTRVASRIDETTARTARLMGQLKTQAGNIAHDLRTPLARLRAGLEDELVTNPQAPGAIAEALAQTDAIIETFNALLRIAAVESGSSRKAFAPVDLAAIGEQVAQTFAPVIEEAGHGFELRMTKGPPIQGDASLLVQLLANLIQNALRYGTPPDRPGHITLVAGPDILELHDNGPGIPEDMRARVLEPLFRIDATRQSEGHGLGLALVKAITDLHGAELQLTDNPDTGRGLAVRVKFGRN